MSSGYSRLAGSDEERTLARLRGLRSDLIDPAIAAHHGRVVKRTGDGVLIEFRSVVDAVRCAIEVQNGMVERNAGLPNEKFIDLGEKELKNIARPVRAYAIKTGSAGPALETHAPTPNKVGPPRLSIVVLPFANIAGDPEQEYFVDGVTESLTTDLSRISGSFVMLSPISEGMSI
jgi:adenylate cyclase